MVCNLILSIIADVVAAGIVALLATLFGEKILHAVGRRINRNRLRNLSEVPHIQVTVSDKTSKYGKALYLDLINKGECAVKFLRWYSCEYSQDKLTIHQIDCGSDNWWVSESLGEGMCVSVPQDYLVYGLPFETNKYIFAELSNEFYVDYRLEIWPHADSRIIRVSKHVPKNGLRATTKERISEEACKYNLTLAVG